MNVGIQALVRHLLTAFAGGMFVKYNVDGATADAIVGGFSALAGILWSLAEKRNK